MRMEMTSTLFEGTVRHDVPGRPGSSAEGGFPVRGHPSRPASRLQGPTGLEFRDAAVSELESVRSVCEEVKRAMMAGEEGLSTIAQQARLKRKNQLGYLGHLVHNMKKLVWGMKEV